MTIRPQANTDLLEDLVRRTAGPEELVKDLYEGEVTKLKADGTVDSYTSVIASQRVKRKLSTRGRAGVVDAELFPGITGSGKADAAPESAC